MRLGERLTAARRDAQIRGAEAFMAGELDDAHLLAEHRAACDEIKRLKLALEMAADFACYQGGVEPCECCLHVVDLVDETLGKVPR